MSESDYPTGDQAQDTPGIELREQLKPPFDIGEFFHGRNPSTPKIDALLEEAARLHIRTFGPPEGGETSGNIFIWASERAFWRVMPKGERFSEGQGDFPNEGFHLYRLWSIDERLLYVGVSTKLRSRLRVHERRWPGLIAKITYESHNDAPSMLAAESLAIREEMPALNKAGIV